MRQYIDIGEKATWSHLQHIQHVLKIEKLIDSTIKSLKKELISNKKRSSMNGNGNGNENDNGYNSTPPLLSHHSDENIINGKFVNSSYYLKQ